MSANTNFRKPQPSSLEDFIKENSHLNICSSNLKEHFYNPIKPPTFSYKEMSDQQRSKWENESKGK